MYVISIAHTCRPYGYTVWPGRRRLVLGLRYSASMPIRRISVAMCLRPEESPSWTARSPTVSAAHRCGAYFQNSPYSSWFDFYEQALKGMRRIQWVFHCVIYIKLACQERNSERRGRLLISRSGIVTTALTGTENVALHTDIGSARLCSFSVTFPDSRHRNSEWPLWD